MPCNSEYLRPSASEERLKECTDIVIDLLTEHDTGIEPSDQASRHDKYAGNRGTYNTERLDELVSLLCSKLKGKDVSKYSLEMQIWWRDHQRADQARIES